ncbi:hypothetical protein K438DRAFT_1771841 [Mycena galopus ATCC 62051]|nr:hypothetical protein K438DRAFT_1771841 [Mycena galopus ATCC 62051]
MPQALPINVSIDPNAPLLLAPPRELTARQQFLHVITKVDRLLSSVQQLSRDMDDIRTELCELQSKLWVTEPLPLANPTSAAQLPPILDRLCEEETQDQIWVRVKAPSPEEIAELNHGIEDFMEEWWIVYIGREPGIYRIQAEADEAVKGCPIQQYRVRTGKATALAFYRIVRRPYQS